MSHHQYGRSQGRGSGSGKKRRSVLGTAAIVMVAVAGAAGILALVARVNFGPNIFGSNFVSLDRIWTLVPQLAEQQPRPAIHSQADRDLVTVLLRTTLVAVHQGNITGNYTVLRDLAAPAFQDKNSMADLALNFAPLRQQKLDLAPVVLLEPQFTKEPTIEGNNVLRIVGTLQSKPVPVAYELAFQVVKGFWRPSAILVTPAPQAAAARSPPQPSWVVGDRFPQQ